MADENDIQVARELGQISSSLSMLTMTINGMDVKVDTLVVRTAEQEVVLPDHGKRIEK